MTTSFPRLRPPAQLKSTFAAARHRNFRLFLIGQFVSVCGTWIQAVAQGWLVLQLTNSAFAVGAVTALGSLPILLFTLYGGVVADRVNKRRLVILLQSLMLLQALLLGLLMLFGAVTVAWVIGLSVVAGLVSAFEVPTRQSFISEIVAREDLMNAIALNASAFNVARVVGPAVAGALIATVGLAACFFLNAASFLAVLIALLLMRVKPRSAPPPAGSALAALREGFGYVFGNRWPRAVVTIAATFSVFGFSFLTLMPVFARDVLRLDAAGYGALLSAAGAGAAAAGLFMAAWGHRARRHPYRLVLGSALLFGVLLTMAAFAPKLGSALVLFTAAECAMVLSAIATNTTLQSEAPDHLRGRVMGFYSFVVLGMAPFGSFLIGWTAEHFGVRAAFAGGGVVCLAVAGVVTWRLVFSRAREQPSGTGR